MQVGAGGFTICRIPPCGSTREALSAEYARVTYLAVTGQLMVLDAIVAFRSPVCRTLK